MHVSEAKIIANRENALKSTGPKTEEGKKRSRANALKHGLCSSVVVEEDQALIDERTRDLFFGLKPQCHYHNWLVDKAAVISLRIDRAERIERRVRDKVSLKAELVWDDERRLEAEHLGNMLASHSSQTVQALKRTPQGCEWLLARWAMLAFVADEGNGWTEDQTNLAFDMLATPAAFREGRTPGVGLTFDGVRDDFQGDLSAVARREIAAIKAQREVVAEIDEAERALAGADLVNDSEPELRRLRRYEGALYSRFRWCVKQINDYSPGKSPSPDLVPNWVADPLPEEKPEKPTEDEKLAAAHPANSIHPPFDLEPDEFPEPGKNADIPMILASRKQKRIRKAEARRDARRRNVEKLRA
jgi:hypothetical protein